MKPFKRVALIYRRAKNPQNSILWKPTGLQQPSQQKSNVLKATFSKCNDYVSIKHDQETFSGKGQIEHVLGI